MVELIRQAEKSTRSGIKKVSSKENTSKIARKGIFKNFKKNEKVKFSDLSFLRPGIGLTSDQYKLIVNKKQNLIFVNINHNLKMFK